MLNGGQCNLCDQPDTFNDHSETATVRSNVRKFEDEHFKVWRCSSCQSIHACEEQELDQYYAYYPFHKQKMDWILRTVYHTFIVRLHRCGLRYHHRILDYGCGSGHLVNYLRSKGFEYVQGYDAYSKIYDDPAILEQQYDCVIAQDLVEHALDPRELLITLNHLVSPSGIILIGTPNAEAIDLTHANQYIHALHQPFHTHMFSKEALLQAGSDVGWTLDHLYMTQYTNTRIPFMNANFALHYAKCFDNNLDLAFDPVRINSKLILSWRTWYLALLGYFHAPETDITAIFRTQT